MNLPLRQTLSRHWFRFQRELFPWLEETLRPLREHHQRLVRVEESLPYSKGWRGRPLKDRAALARAFLAKAVLDVPTTRGLVERLKVEPTGSLLSGGHEQNLSFATQMSCPATNFAKGSYLYDPARFHT